MRLRKFNPAWDQKFAEWVATDPKITIETPEGPKVHSPKESMKTFNDMELPQFRGDEKKKEKYHQLMSMKTDAEQKAWRKWFINSGLIRWMVMCEADKGGKGLASRIKQEWGDLADEYDLQEEFNKAYKDVIAEYK